MAPVDEPVAIHRTVLETLTVDAMVLADEVETFFHGPEFETMLGGLDPDRRAATSRVAFEIGQRLNGLVQLLVRGEPLPTSPDPAWTPEDEALLAPQPRALAEATRELTGKIERLSISGDPGNAAASPARELQRHIADRLGFQRGE